MSKKRKGAKKQNPNLATKEQEKLTQFQEKQSKKDQPSLKKVIGQQARQELKVSADRHLYHDEKENAALELAHKAENVVLTGGGVVLESHKKKRKAQKSEKLTYNAEMEKLRSQFEGRLQAQKAQWTGQPPSAIKITDEEIIREAYSKGYSANSNITKAEKKKTSPKKISSGKSLVVPKSYELQYGAKRAMSSQTLGQQVLVKEGQTLLGKGINSATSKLKFAGGQATKALRSQYDSYMNDNSGTQALSSAMQFSSPAGKYALKKTGRVVSKQVSNSFIGRSWQNARQAARRMIARRQRQFLAKHSEIAKARGATQKAKAVAKEIIKSMKPLGGILAVFLLLLVLINTIAAPLAAMFKSGAEAYVTTTYPADNGEITATTVQWKELEALVLEDIEKTEINYPDYYKYEYEIDDFKYNAFEFMGFLSAMKLDFTYDQVKSLIEEIFQKQNVLSRVVRKEIINGDEVEILVTKLEVGEFREIILPYLESKDAVEVYDLYMESNGNRQAFGSPFPTDWRGQVRSQYGKRPNPTGAGYDFHTGLDIAYPEGTPIHSIMFGEVVVAGWHKLYGNYVVVRDTDNNSSLYAHCHELKVSVGDMVQKGDIIALVGTTGNSTGNHLHIEITVKGERVNPIYYIGCPGVNEDE